MGYIKYKLTVVVNKGQEVEQYYYSIDELDKEKGCSMNSNSIGITLSPNNKPKDGYIVIFFPYTNIVYYEIEYKKFEIK